jgi:hypothetical protein
LHLSGLFDVNKTKLHKLHKKSTRHRSVRSKSKICGCFYCFKELSFGQMVRWIDNNETALCPYCGVDSVLGFETSTANQALLRDMHEEWFAAPARLTAEEWKSAIEADIWPTGANSPDRK